MSGVTGNLSEDQRPGSVSGQAGKAGQQLDYLKIKYLMPLMSRDPQVHTPSSQASLRATRVVITLETMAVSLTNACFWCMSKS
jgi:hypothetical protein